MRSAIHPPTSRRIAIGSALVAATLVLAVPGSPAAGAATASTQAGEGSTTATAATAAASKPCKRAKRQLKRANRDLEAAQDLFRNGRGVRDAIEARQKMQDAEERIAKAKAAKRKHC